MVRFTLPCTTRTASATFRVEAAGFGTRFTGAVLAPGADGRFTLPFVPAGRGAIHRALGSGTERTVTTLLELKVPARGTREVHLP